MKTKYNVYQKELGYISESSDKKIIDFLKEKIENEHHIHIDKVIIEPEQVYCGKKLDESNDGYTCLFKISFTFIGTNSNNLKYIYTCKCNANYFLSKEELKYAKDNANIHFDDEFSGFYSFNKNVEIESIKDTDINIEKISNNPVKNILYQCDYDIHEIIYQAGDTNFDESVLCYLRLSDSNIKEFNIDSFTEDNGNLYICQELDCPEFDLDETPYFRIYTTSKQMNIIKNKIIELSKINNEYYTHYYYYKELYRNDKFLIYKWNNRYYMVTNPELIYRSKLYNNISDLLHVNNCWDLGISGEVENIMPAIYKCISNINLDINYELNDNKKYIRSIGAEKENSYTADDMLIINMKDGSQGYMFLNIPLNEQEEKNNHPSKSLVKRAIYLAPKNNNKN